MSLHDSCQCDKCKEAPMQPSVHAECMCTACVDERAIQAEIKTICVDEARNEAIKRVAARKRKERDERHGAQCVAAFRKRFVKMRERMANQMRADYEKFLNCGHCLEMCPMKWHERVEGARVCWKCNTVIQYSNSYDGMLKVTVTRSEHSEVDYGISCEWVDSELEDDACVCKVHKFHQCACATGCDCSCSTCDCSSIDSD